MTENADNSLNPHDVERLVKSRAWLGDFFADLWRFANSHDLTTLDDHLSRTWHLLLGVGFSLWRAAFLLKGERTPREFHQDATTFLEEVLWTNAISFAKDLNTRSWTSGYYLNSAALRLARVREILPTLTAEDASSFQGIEAFLESSFQPTGQMPDVKAGWDACRSAAAVALARLEETAPTV